MTFCSTLLSSHSHICFIYGGALANIMLGLKCCPRTSALFTVVLWVFLAMHSSCCGLCYRWWNKLLTFVLELFLLLDLLLFCIILMWHLISVLNGGASTFFSRLDTGRWNNNLVSSVWGRFFGLEVICCFAFRCIEACLKELFTEYDIKRCLHFLFIVCPHSRIPDFLPKYQEMLKQIIWSQNC